MYHNAELAGGYRKKKKIEKDIKNKQARKGFFNFLEENK